ncbi:hypothetical protein RD792_014133 [Penstemon davidsonii]|uniref:Pentatricopeptide repeat-containing protein n=1 Tax=Penstemon davidsonii TaxID=160366 RepID=A0ABR0CQS2_9LAMI|nr:hypothetical protein RD792_014133 [Penstemon davidsonii]
MSQLSLRGEVEHARKIFDQMCTRDSVSWNIMIKCYIENAMVENARELFDEMPERTSVSWNTMIMGYIKTGRTNMALKLFIVTPDKDVVTWTAMITGLCRASRVNDAWLLFEKMPEPNAVSWSSIISGFQQNGFANESLNVFKKMLSVGIQLTSSHLFTSVLSACADLTMVSLSEQVYSQILKRGFHANYTLLGNSAITTFVKTGSFHNARLVFLDLDKPDIVTWNAMITGFAQYGYGLEAMMIFHQMQKAKVLPDGISYMGVLHGCSHNGYVKEGEQYFQSMKTDYGISPGLEHFAAMVDLYARAGKLEKAYKIIIEMPFEPTVVFWRTLLSGCRKWGDLDMALCAAEEILKLEPYNSSACLMVIDMFALAGKWEDVRKMRRVMRKTEARKELGCSWIDVKGRNYLFTTGDKIHPEADWIFSVIELLRHDCAIDYTRLEGFPNG